MSHAISLLKVFSGAATSGLKSAISQLKTLQLVIMKSWKYFN